METNIYIYINRYLFFITRAFKMEEKPLSTKDNLTETSDVPRNISFNNLEYLIFVSFIINYYINIIIIYALTTVIKTEFLQSL